MQVKFLRALEDKEIQRASDLSRGNLKIDVRVIASTNKDLTEAILNGTFREGFYYKLNVVPIEIPPLRHRKEDVGDLLDLFIKKYDTYRKIKGFTLEAMKLLKNYNWPGNIRELENAIERIVILAKESYIKAAELPIEILGLLGITRSALIYRMQKHNIN